MNVKQEKGVFKKEPDLTEQTEHDDVFDEIQPNKPGPEETVEIKEEIIDYEEPKIEQSSDLLPKIDHDSVPEKNNVQCCPTIKKELENTSEVKDRDVKDIKKDNSEYIQSEFEVLTTHCDLPTLKNENTEYPDSLTEQQVDGVNDNASTVLNKKRKLYTRRKNFNGHFLKRRVDYEFNGKLSKKNYPNKHFITCTNEKSFQCNICSKKWSRKYYLQLHLRTHTNEKPFKCNICFKDFKQKSSLRTHLKIHTNEKPFKCNVCFKEFTRKYSLQYHLLTHANEKLFHCNMCSKKFNNKANLRKHLRTHANEKPFLCNICPKEFVQKSNLERHLRTHTNEKPFQCNMCSKKFNDPSNLLKHLKKHK